MRVQPTVSIRSLAASRWRATASPVDVSPEPPIHSVGEESAAARSSTSALITTE
ncbi:hypothetical protein ACFCWB_21575 [Streptomyces bacillaris]|uniref:hypothetical protein n=1 Tax=Streptomyces bacillaris TaxID=68179 RepID=UPI0035D75BAD